MSDLKNLWQDGYDTAKKETADTIEQLQTENLEIDYLKLRIGQLKAGIKEFIADNYGFGVDCSTLEKLVPPEDKP